MERLLNLGTLALAGAVLTIFYFLLRKYIGAKKSNVLMAAVVLLGMPLAGFYITQNYTKNHVIMPKKYFYDGVTDVEVNGKKETDTLWHKVKNLTLVNQYGDTTTLDALRGKVLLVNFFFTSCPTICPRITTNLLRVQQSILKDSGIQMLSITIDPKRDSVQTLRKYASQYGIKHDNWWLCQVLTDSLAQLLYKEFKSGYEADSSVQILHSPDVYLLDKKRIMRGRPMNALVTPENPESRMFYNGKDTADMIQLIVDAGLVKMEKPENGKPPFILLIISLVVMGVVFVGLLFILKKKPITTLK